MCTCIPLLRSPDKIPNDCAVTCVSTWQTSKTRHEVQQIYSWSSFMSTCLFCFLIYIHIIERWSKYNEDDCQASLWKEPIFGARVLERVVFSQTLLPRTIKYERRGIARASFDFHPPSCWISLWFGFHPWLCHTLTRWLVIGSIMWSLSFKWLSCQSSTGSWSQQ